MHGRPVRMTVDQRVHAKTGEGCLDGRRTDVGDRIHRALRLQTRLVRLARGAGLLRERQPRVQWLREELPLPARIACLRSELLLSDVVAA